MEDWKGEHLVSIIRYASAAICVADDCIHDINERVDSADSLQVVYCNIAQHLEDALELAKDLVLDADHENQSYTEAYKKERGLK